MKIEKLYLKIELLKYRIASIDLNHENVSIIRLITGQYFNIPASQSSLRISTLNIIGLCKFATSYYLYQQGKHQIYFNLNHDQLLIVMAFTYDKANHFKADFIQLFNQRENELLHWREKALLTSDSTKQAKDQVHRLQGSLRMVIPTFKRSTLQFIHLQQAITLAATGSTKTKRHSMISSKLILVEVLEALLQTEIKRLMDQGIAPEQGGDYVLAVIKKEDLTSSVETLRKGFLNNTIDHNRTRGIRQIFT